MECDRNAKHGVVHLLKAPGTFPSPENIHTRDHSAIHEDSTTLFPGPGVPRCSLQKTEGQTHRPASRASP